LALYGFRTVYPPPPAWP